MERQFDVGSKVRACAVMVAGLGWLLLAGAIGAQEKPLAPAPIDSPFSLPAGGGKVVPLPSGPSTFQTSDYKIRVVTVADGLSRPWAVAFLPNGDMLITERTGQLRIVRGGVLDPRPVPGVPDVDSRGSEGLMDIALHPNFAQNRYVYLTYTKRGEPGTAVDEPCPYLTPGRTVCGTTVSDPKLPSHATALARGTFDGQALTNVRDLFVAEKWTPRLTQTLGSRIAFGRDGMLYMTVAGPNNAYYRAQEPGNHQGKVLRLRDDGTVPPDNPFAGQPAYKPQIYSLGHRNPLGLVFHPVTGALWEIEAGPQGGDELNQVLPGRNYGFPHVSFGREYSGDPYPPHGSKPGFESPVLFWVPAITPSGLTFYSGDKFPKWKDSAFLGSLMYMHLERVVFNAKFQNVRQEWMLMELKQRIRDVREGPDGYLYLLTDASKGALLRIEPAE